MFLVTIVIEKVSINNICFQSPFGRPVLIEVQIIILFSNAAFTLFNPSCSVVILVNFCMNIGINDIRKPSVNPVL